MSGTVQNLYEICCCYCTSVCLDFTESWKCRLILRIVYNVDKIFPDVQCMLLIRLNGSRHLWEAIGKDERKRDREREAGV